MKRMILVLLTILLTGLIISGCSSDESSSPFEKDIAIPAIGEAGKWLLAPGAGFIVDVAFSSDGKTIYSLGSNSHIFLRKSVDGGHTWVIGNKQEAFCAHMDTGEFFSYLGSLALKVEGIANLEITDPQVNKILEEKGPNIHGYPTTHVRLVTTAAGKAAVLFKKYDYKVHITDDIWYSTNLEMHPVRKRWLEAL